MIAALAHDLRTPLTKLQLRLTRVEPETLRDQLADTAKGMNAILTQGLEFARSLRTEEPMTKVDLPSFLQSLADDYADLGRAVTFQCDSALEANPQTGVLPARPLCLKRCMENLLTNACAYAGSAEIRLTAEKEALVVTVSDRGLGIPEELLEKVFEPYFRVEGSRNRASGRTGLGQKHGAVERRGAFAREPPRRRTRRDSPISTPLNRFPETCKVFPPVT